MAAPALTVQVVLYETPLATVRRQLHGICAAAAQAVGANVFSEVRLRYGDCSPAPVLDASDVAELEGRAHGLGEVGYEFFAANLGSAGGSNRIAAASGTPFLFVLNPDAHPDPQALVRLGRAARAPGVGAVDARQLPVEHHKAFDPATGATGWVSGAALLARRAAFDEVGGFDADVFPLYGDDVDLSWRLRLAGWRLLHVPEAVVFHDKSVAPDATVVPTPSEVRQAPLVWLLLCRRYGRPDLVDAGLCDLAARPDDPVAVEALAVWGRAEREGRLPGALPGAESVAHLSAGHYAPRRF
jgi:hypothetical protein